MSNSINSGMISQLITNSQSNDFQNTHNFSVGTQMVDFDINHKLTLSRDYDNVVPQYIVIRLHANDDPGLTAAVYIHSICRRFSKIRLIMQISDQTIFQIPLSLLHAISPAELHYDNLYIKIPFSAFFDKINVIGLYHSNVSFVIKDFNEIVNYASYCSLVTTVYMHNIEARNNMTSTNSRTNIQQIGTLHVSNNTNNGRNYQIKTNNLNGSTKGLLIQCNILDLQSIKFYINNLLRFDLNHFFISITCVKLSEKLLYLPFNDCLNFQNRDVNTFAGAINLSELQNSTLCLQFSRDQPEIVIHNVYLNYFCQIYGLGGLHIDNVPSFISNTTEDHPIQPIVGTPPNASLLDMSGNYIINHIIPGLNGRTTGNYINTTTSTFGPQGNVGLNNYSVPNGRTTGNYINTTTSTSTSTFGPQGTVGLNNYPIPNGTNNYPIPNGTNNYPIPNGTNNYPIPNGTNNYPIPNGLLINRLLNPDRITCNITHEDIGSEQHYMSCVNCENNFVESALKQWLRPRTGNLRTCPTCREVWTNFDVYINQTDIDEYIYSMPE